MEERQRIKIVDYVGSNKVDQGKIEEELKKRGIRLNLDSFIDPGLVRRVAGIVREIYAEKGYKFAEVKPTIKEVAGGPKLVHLTFNINEGPQVKIRDVEFIGNKAVSDGKLRKQMKENKGRGMFSFITGGGTYKEDKFEDDADQRPELLPRPRLHCRAGRAARAEDPRGRERRQDALGGAADSGHRRRHSTASASSSSPATPSSRPNACDRCSS